MNIAQLAIPTKVVEAEFPGIPGFVVKLSFISRALTKDITKEATVTKMDPTYMKPIQEIDSDKFVEIFCKKSIIGWSGLTIEGLSNLLLIAPSDTPEEEVPFNLENAIYLMKNSTVFDAWVNSVVFNLDQFRAK